MSVYVAAFRRVEGARLALLRARRQVELAEEELVAYWGGANADEALARREEALNALRASLREEDGR